MASPSSTRYCYNMGVVSSLFQIRITFDPKFGPAKEPIVFDVLNSEHGSEAIAFVHAIRICADTWASGIAPPGYVVVTSTLLEHTD